MVRFSLILVVVFGWAGVGNAAEPTTIIESRRSVAPSAKDYTFEVPPFSIEHQVRLSLECRIDWKSLAGSNPWIRVAVNGTWLTSKDLLNKSNDFEVRNHLDLTWYRRGGWRVLYSPDFEAAIVRKDDPMACPDADPYHYLWDITPYVQPGENTLRVQHLQALAKPTTLVLRNVEVEVGKPISPPESDEDTPAPTGPVPTFVAKPKQSVPMDVTVSKAGAFGLAAGGRRFDVNTRTSLPGGKWHEPADASRPRTLSAGQSVKQQWRAGNYRVERQLAVRDDHVHVADTITNTSNALIGVIVEHRLPYADKPGEVRLAGRETISERAGALNPAHPSAFAQLKGMGVGLVAEDDVFRVHVRSMAEPGAIGLVDEQLGIEAGKSVTLEWSVYPVPIGDYWDFVNAVRRNWDCNFTIPGSFYYSMHLPPGKPAEWYGQWARRRDIKICCGSIAKYPNGEYAHGTGIEHAPEWVAGEKEWTRGMLATAPEVKALAYFHAQISTEPDADKKYADSKLIDANGEHLHYPYRYPLPAYLPTRENSYGKALWGYVRTCIDEIGTSGLYWDEMSHSVLWYAHDAPWDGHTVAIDRRTHEVLGKRTSVPLTMQTLKLDIIKHLRDNGKFLMGNSQPATRTMLRQKILRFVETGTYSAVINTHLGCPMGLGNHHPENNQADRAKHVRNILRRGAVYYGHIYNSEPPEWNFQSIMFPITPVELRAGVVLGAERIHTAVSGLFGWPDGAAAKVHVIDAQGRRVASGMVKETTKDGQRLHEIRMPGDHFAILVKLP